MTYKYNGLSYQKRGCMESDQGFFFLHFEFNPQKHNEVCNCIHIHGIIMNKKRTFSIYLKNVF